VLSERQLAKAANLLNDGEQIIAAVHAETGLSYSFVLLNVLLRHLTKQWVVVRTDRRFVLLKGGAATAGGASARSVAREYPLDAPAGFSRSGLWLRLTLDGDRFRVSGADREDLEVLVGQREPDRPVPMTLECVACGYLNREDAVACSKCAQPLR
jgi:hypothetical protein